MRTIILKPRGTGRIDDDAAFVIAEDLVFDIKKIFANGQYHAKTQLNGVKHEYTIGETLTIPKADLAAGELFITVIYTPARGEQVTYTVDPLRLTELEADFAAEPTIKALDAKIESLGQVITNNKQLLMAQITALREEFTKLLDGRDAALAASISGAVKSAIAAADENAAAIDEKLGEVVNYVLKGNKKKKKK